MHYLNSLSTQRLSIWLFHKNSSERERRNFFHRIKNSQTERRMCNVFFVSCAFECDSDNCFLSFKLLFKSNFKELLSKLFRHIVGMPSGCTKKKCTKIKSTRNVNVRAKRVFGTKIASLVACFSLKNSALEMRENFRRKNLSARKIPPSVWSSKSAC